MNTKSKKVLALLMVLILGTTLLSGCIRAKEEYIENEKDEQSSEVETTDSPYPMEVEDDFGNKVTIDKKPERIISLAPSHTEILFKLGLSDSIVGVTSICDYPKEAKTKEIVGDSMTVDVEKVIALEPDLVLHYGSDKEKEYIQRLRDAEINVLSYQPESIQEVIDLIIEIGRITQTQVAATKTTVDMMSKMDYIVHTVEEVDKPKVFYEVWHDPLMTAGPGSFIDELITLAGGENIAKDAQGLYPQFELEQLIERNPDVYISSDNGGQTTKESIMSREGYETLSAVKNDRVYILDANIISRPGPRIVDGLEMIAKAIHPELFKK
ncbi:ABC transporter substrate-binding protein [Caldisalinibacter kiritimatiensis]|uniref:Vitamin B12 ABC transporter, B12-binding component BtuF n=1 Tax=Caldisalinibacter kiritimatiensis TaxID=1304284 RepID=R1CC80_9FIRM|nr:cobalamin-binding protein [Caldisalinibacter kiritimatiensis]EOC99909.1 Vitamin B12 ABC transporter, B12-binding component BtuF [Caldisalinibacter kiritimatiensis]